MPPCHCEERSDEAIPLTKRVIARSEATKQSPATTRNLVSLQAAKRRSNPPYQTCHCEERSDEAISCAHPQPRVIASSEATKQSRAPTRNPVSLQAAKRRSNLLRPPVTPCHCKQRSDEAISFTSRVIASSERPKQSPSHPVNRGRLLRLPRDRLPMTLARLTGRFALQRKASAYPPPCQQRTPKGGTIELHLLVGRNRCWSNALSRASM